MGLRERGARLLARSGLGRRASRRSRWQGTLVLCYHRIGGSATGAAWSASLEAFERQLELVRRRFEVIPPSEVLEATRSRRGRFAAITFDDGFRDGFEVAFPVLQAHDVPAAFFVTTGFLDRGGVPWWDEIAYRARHCSPRVLDDPEWLDGPVILGERDRAVAVKSLLRSYKRLDGGRAAAYLEFLRAATGNEHVDARRTGSRWLTWDMVRRMRAGGMEIGGHTVNHPILAAQPPEVQQAEIDGCAARIEAELGEPMRLFSYPVGLRDSFDATTRSMARGAGVELAFSCYGGVTTRRSWDPLDIRRMPIGPAASEERIRSLLDLPRLFARI
jgi:peptidoglycan/xylan/chitin deacetylase (PgdA/CDA1 family)